MAVFQKKYDERWNFSLAYSKLLEKWYKSRKSDKKPSQRELLHDQDILFGGVGTLEEMVALFRFFTTLDQRERKPMWKLGGFGDYVKRTKNKGRSFYYFTLSFRNIFMCRKRSLQDQ